LKKRPSKPEPRPEDKYNAPKAGVLSVRDQIALEQSNTMQRHFKGRRSRRFEA
jgi:hypothetical protein